METFSAEPFACESELFTFKHLHIKRYNTCIPLKRLDTSESNSPPQPGKVSPGMDDQMPAGYPWGCTSFELIGAY